MEQVEQATAAPGAIRVLPCQHDTLYRIGLQYRCEDCNELVVRLFGFDTTLRMPDGSPAPW